MSSLRSRLIRLFKTLVNGRALVCFRVSIVPPIASVAIDGGLERNSKPIAPRLGFERWARVQRPPPRTFAGPTAP